MCGDVNPVEALFNPTSLVTGTSTAGAIVDPLGEATGEAAAAGFESVTHLEEMKEQQEEAIATAQRKQEELLASQEAEKKRLAEQKQTRVASQIKSAILRRQGAARQPQLGQTTGPQGVRDRLISLGKAKLGG